jgi:hypothetical protein
MKKLLFLGVALLMLTPCFSQVEDGDLILGGALRIQADGDKLKTEDGDVFKDYKDMELTVGPHVHYMFHPHMSVGGTIFFNMIRYKEFEYIGGDPDDEVPVVVDGRTGFGLAPLFRYWWGVGEKKKFGFFAEAGLGFSTTKSFEEQFDGDDEPETIFEGTTNTFFVSAVPGIYYSPADCFFFEIKFGGFGFDYFLDSFKEEGSDDKWKSGYFELGGDLDALFFGDTAIGFNLIF